MRRWAATRGAVPAFLCLVLAAGRLQAGTQDLEFKRAFQRANESMVRVAATLPAKGAPLRLDAEEATFSNAGFFVSTDGDVLTSLLGLAGCADVTIICADGRKSAARVAAVDQPSGLALLKSDLSGTVPFEPVEGPLAAGTWVLLACCPRQDDGATVLLAPGMVAPQRVAIRLQGVDWPDLMVASVNVRPGCAAAPLLDADGRLAAVVLGVSMARGGVDCLALPVDRVTPILSGLREGRSRRLGWLGLAIMQEPRGREGVRVKATLENSPAQVAGVQANDILLQVDDHTIDSPAVLAHEVIESGPGRTVNLKLLRGDEIKTVPVAIGARPLLICGAFRRPGDDLVQVRWRQIIGPLFPPEAFIREQERVPALLDENRLLRQRVRELEERVRLLERQKSE
jgi:S1-C subfamily serine protease